MNGDRRNHDIHAVSLRQARVHQGLLVIDAPAQRRHDAVDDKPQLCLAVKTLLSGIEPTLALKENVIGSVDHDLRDGIVEQKRLERS